MSPRRYALLAAIEAIAVAALFVFIVACSKGGGGDSPAPQQQVSNDAPAPVDDAPCDETRLAARDMDGVCRDHEMGALAVAR